MNPLCPEPSNPDKHFKTHLWHIGVISGIPNVVEDGEGNSSVAMDLLKGDFPFVMAFFPIHGHHGVKRSPIFETELLRILDSPVQLIVAVFQEIPCDLLVFGHHIKRQTVGFGIPVGTTSVFFARKSFWSNIQARVLTGIGLV